MRNLFKNLLLTLLFIIIFSRCSFAYTHNKSLDEAVTRMLKEDYNGAVDECERLERYGDKQLKAEALYLKGACFFKIENYTKAREVFKKALSYAKGEASTEIYMGIADSYFMEYKYSKAIAIYEQLLDKIKNEDAYLCTLYYKLGKSYQKESEWAKTKYYFNLLKKKFPESFESELVSKTSVGGNFFTIQVGCFSSQRNAEKLQHDLDAKGYDVYLTPFKSNGRQLYRVRVGEFMSRAAAVHTEARLKSIEHLPTHIFP